MSTVYLHIGTQKTGTTALQSFLRENEKVLEQNGYCYPVMNLNIAAGYNDRNAHFLVDKSVYKNLTAKKTEQVMVREKGYQLIGDLAERFPNIVLSDEIIWHKSNQWEDFWESLIENFRKVNCEVKIIVYLRRQDLMVQSLWNQSIKGINRISKTFQECLETDYFKYYPLDYYQHLLKIAEHVKKEDIIVRVYEKNQFAGASIYSDFLDSIGLQLTTQYTNNNILPNHGIDGNFVEFKRITNGLPEYQNMSNFLRGPISLASDCHVESYSHARVSMFSYEDQIAYVKGFEENNNKVAKEFLGRDDGKLFLEPIQELPLWELQTEELYKDMLMYIGEAFCQQEAKILMLKEEIRTMKSDTRFIYNSLIFKIYRKLRNMIKRER